MNLRTSVLSCLLLLCAVPAMAQSSDYPDLYAPSPYYYTPPPVYTPSPYDRREDSGRTYDWRSGSVYRWNREADGTTEVRGHNVYTGRQWRSTVEPDGSQRGYDGNMNPWRYNGRTGTYMNLGTGEICIGKGGARTCSK